METLYVFDVEGIRTTSITWTTPFDPIMSALVTVELSIITPFILMLTVKSVKFKFWSAWPSDKDVETALSSTTWCFKILVYWGRSLNKLPNVPGGNKSKAASVGANSVNGPLPDNTPSSEQVSIATFKVVWSAELDTIS